MAAHNDVFLLLPPTDVINSSFNSMLGLLLLLMVPLDIYIYIYILKLDLRILSYIFWATRVVIWHIINYTIATVMHVGIFKLNNKERIGRRECIWNSFGYCRTVSKQRGVWIQWNGMVEWNGGMDWNGGMEWTVDNLDGFNGLSPPYNDHRWTKTTFKKTT